MRGASIVLQKLQVCGILLEVRLKPFRVQYLRLDLRGSRLPDGDLRDGAAHCVDAEDGARDKSVSLSE